ncbi:uncharacterized protein METZ01_LOCUS227603 [marine metagenome]|uniref:Uncharacterized protein n=1 Tax=marine metagenome TaxID=408172 RepID=A0A382GIF7_9ZZZZ
MENRSEAGCYDDSYPTLPEPYDGERLEAAEPEVATC